MAYFFRLLFITFFSTIIFSCGNESSNSNASSNSTEEKCKYGTPTSIFSKDLEKVIDHSFSAKGQKGAEKIMFENGVQLELLQDGCNELLQSYQFTISGDTDGDDQFWIEQAVEQFRYLSTLSENHLSFSLWAGAIAKGSEYVSLGETFEPEPNTFIKIDKIPSGDKIILVVTFVGKG